MIAKDLRYTPLSMCLALLLILSTVGCGAEAQNTWNSIKRGDINEAVYS